MQDSDWSSSPNEIEGATQRCIALPLGLVAAGNDPHLRKDVALHLRTENAAIALMRGRQGQRSTNSSHGARIHRITRPPPAADRAPVQTHQRRKERSP